MYAVNIGGVRAAAFSFVLHDVHPPVLIGFLQDVHIVLSQGCQGLQRKLLRLVKSHLPFHVLHHRHIDIVHVELLYAEETFPKAHIPVHFIKVAAHAADQPVTDRGIHIVGCDRRLKGGTVVPGPGVESLLLHLAFVQRCKGMDELLVPAVEFLKDFLPERAVRGHLQRDKAAVGDLDLLLRFLIFRRHAVRCPCLFYRRELQIRVLQHAEAVPGRLGHLS